MNSWQVFPQHLIDARLPSGASRAEPLDDVLVKPQAHQLGYGVDIVVVLPEIAGTSAYTIELPDGQKFTVDPNHVFDFTSLPGFADGVARFDVLGIEPDSGLNPYDPLAFDAGVTFIADGIFTGSTDPIVSVPEPSTWALMIAGFVGLGVVGSRRAGSRGPIGFT